MATRKVNTAPATQPEPVEAPIEIQAVTIALPKLSMQLHPSGPVTGAPVVILRPIDPRPVRVSSVAMFSTAVALCRHVYNIVSDDSDAETKVRVVGVVMAGNDHLWAPDQANTGGGGGVDERNARVSEGGQK